MFPISAQLQLHSVAAAGPSAAAQKYCSSSNRNLRTHLKPGIG